MLAKVFACSLVLLILSPFTAPFSTCDLSRPITHQGQGGHGHSLPFVPRRATTAAALESATVLVPARAATGRTHLVQIVAPHLRYIGAPAPANVRRFADSVSPPRDLGAVLTILRL